MHSNKYIFIYSSAMVVIVAIALTVVAIALKPLQEKNIRVEKMRNILLSANIESTAQTAEGMYKKYVTRGFIVNSKGDSLNRGEAFEVDVTIENKKPLEERKLPVYICQIDNKGTFYIFPVKGKGLWGPIWGYVALKSDLNTVAGTMFDHKGETPGLGAEIDTRLFQLQFIDKQIFDESGKFTSVKAKKGGAAKGDLHGVDAISGGTITSNGLSDMMVNGLGAYENFIKQHKKGNHGQ